MVNCGAVKVKPVAGVKVTAMELTDRVVEYPITFTVKPLAVCPDSVMACKTGAALGTVNGSVVGLEGVKFMPPVCVLKLGVNVIVEATLPV